MRARLALAAIALLCASFVAPTASARSSEDYTYAFDQTWRAAVRLLAVDMRFPITDRDPEIGYVLFEYQEGGRTYSGSLELVRTEGRNATPQVRVVVSVTSMPSYVERMLIERLSRKLTQDYGAPPPSRRPPEPTPPPEAPPVDGAPDDAPTDPA